MRGRNKYDWSKPFKIIETKKAFDELETNDQNLVIVLQSDEKVVQKKEQIIVPKIETVKRITEVKPFAKITPNYIRLPKHLNLPRQNDYQLTEVDYVFLQGHQEKFKLNGKSVLTIEFLARIFVELETKAGKDTVIPRSKSWILAFIQRENPQMLKMDNYDLFTQTVYNFWKNRREELKFPLLRTLWKPNPDEYNHLLAFKVRDKDKRNLRRTNRFVEDEIVEELLEQFDLALKVTERVQMREDLKLKSLQISLSSFHQECKALFPTPDFIIDVLPQHRQKDKEKLKKLHFGLETFKSKRQTEETDIAQDAVENVLNTKHTVINFLSTVIYEAELLGISYEKIFHSSTNSIIEKPKTINQNISFQIPAITQAIDVASNNDECLNINLKRMGDLIVRQFDVDLNQKVHVAPCRTLLDYKRRCVDCFYFGSDDEGDYKDLKKNISTSFKKFQQFNKSTAFD